MNVTLGQLIKYYKKGEPKYNGEKDQQSAFWAV
jgi:hypothetical protein